MKNLKLLFALLLFSLSGFSQSWSGDKITAKKQFILRTVAIEKIVTSQPDSLLGDLTDAEIATNRAIKLYIDKRLAACGCNAGVVVIPGPTALSAASQPQSLSVTAGQSATFSFSVIGGQSPISFQWKKGSTNISGATAASYTISSTQLSDAGSFSAVATDGGGATVTSSVATLTVNSPPAAINVSYAYVTTDPFIDNLTAPAVSYNATQEIQHNASITISFPQAATNKFLVIKVPSGESKKLTWAFDDFNKGTIPDQGFRDSFTVGAFTYYVTREALAFTYTNPFILQ